MQVCFSVLFPQKRSAGRLKIYTQRLKNQKSLECQDLLEIDRKQRQLDLSGHGAKAKEDNMSGSGCEELLPFAVASINT
jgi:hypothetical protein